MGSGGTLSLTAQDFRDLAYIVSAGKQEILILSQLGNKGSTDPMFHPSGNFYHYTSQVGKSDPVPSNPPQNWKRLIGTGGPAVTLAASTSGPSTTLSSGVTRGSGGGSSYSGNITAAKPKASVKPPSQPDIKSMLDNIKLAVDAPMSITPSP